MIMCQADQSDKKNRDHAVVAVIPCENRRALYGNPGEDQSRFKTNFHVSYDLPSFPRCLAIEGIIARFLITPTR